MTQEIAAIVQSAVDLKSITKRVHAANVALQDAERAEKDDGARADRSREQAARRRVELGRELVEARKGWPARGPNAKGWGEFLAKQGIEERSARRYMDLAGHIEFSDTDGDESENQKHADAPVPTYRDAGIDNRPRKSDAEPADAKLTAKRAKADDVSTEKPKLAKSSADLEVEIDRGLEGVRALIRKLSDTADDAGLHWIAHVLREEIKRVEARRLAADQTEAVK